MVQSTPLSSLGRLVSLAYAGTDMPVHLVCESPAGDLVKWALDYPQFIASFESARIGQTPSPCCLRSGIAAWPIRLPVCAGGTS